MSIKVKLIKRAIDGLAPAEKVYKTHDSELPGFSLRIYPNGRKKALITDSVTSLMRIIEITLSVMSAFLLTFGVYKTIRGVVRGSTPIDG